ncbi:MAG: TonB-dependent receptor plug domain-containing protein [Bacteroidales bacterium]|nr:TonB-dependent receptor plug domain-containing protein [Bacteroidales bacterium]
MKRFIAILALLSLTGGVLQAQEKVQDETVKTQYTSVFDLLRTEPGVVVGPSRGAGDTPDIIIRGISTNSGQTQPLFVVDGIITDNVSYLRPEDIYSIEVLKDGTAALYGMQGQNGVIIFKTKAAVYVEKQEAQQRKAERKAAREARRNKKK